MALFLSFLWCLFLIPSYSLCATLTVCPSQCNYTTINSAISAASNNDVVLVSPGTYEEYQVYVAVDLTLACGSGVCVVNTTLGWLNVTGVLTLDGSFALFNPYFTLQGVIELSGSGAIWNQNGDITITTMSCSGPGVNFDAGGTWNQYGTANITVNCDSGTSSGVTFDAGGTWNQYGTANIMVTGSSNGGGVNGVTFDAGGTWNQYGTANVMFNGYVISGVSFESGTWNQYGTANMMGYSLSGSASGVYLYTGTWNQNATANITTNCDSVSYGVTYYEGGTWNQHGDITITSTSSYIANGVYFQNGIWNQYGTANIMVISDGGNGASGVYFYIMTSAGIDTWNQYGTANIITICNNAPSCFTYGLYFYGETSGANLIWNQYGNVMVTASTYAVYFDDCGTWNEYGTNNIPDTGIYNTSCAIIHDSPSSTPTSTGGGGGGGGASSAEALVPHLSATFFSLLSLLM